MLFNLKACCYQEGIIYVYRFIIYIKSKTLLSFILFFQHPLQKKNKKEKETEKDVKDNYFKLEQRKKKQNRNKYRHKFLIPFCFEAK